MSKTRKGAKPSGWDYWGKRHIGMGDFGTKGKRTGIQKERAALKREVSKEPIEPEYREEEYVGKCEQTDCPECGEV